VEGGDAQFEQVVSLGGALEEGGHSRSKEDTPSEGEMKKTVDLGGGGQALRQLQHYEDGKFFRGTIKKKRVGEADYLKRGKGRRQ